MLVADIRISGARSRMDMLPDYFEAAATSKNWKIALQLKLRNFCMRPARRIIDTGRASYVWAECATALIMVEFSEGKFILCRELFLTKSSVNWTVCSVPFCDRGVFRMFISNPASFTYSNVYFSKNNKRATLQGSPSVCVTVFLSTVLQ